MTTAVEPFTWNGDYSDFAQVERFLPAFLEVLDELEGAGQYRYNDSFKGRIPGIEGEREDTAIYMLQGLQRQRAQDFKIADLIAQGYEHIDTLETVERFAHIVLYPVRRMGGEWQEFREARLTPRDGKPYGVLLKGNRTRGALVSDRRALAIRKAA